MAKFKREDKKISKKVFQKILATGNNLRGGRCLHYRIGRLRENNGVKSVGFSFSSFWCFFLFLSSEGVLAV